MIETNENITKNCTQNLDPQGDGVSGDDIGVADLAGQASAEPDRMVGAHQPSVPVTQPGEKQRYQLTH